MANSTPSTPQSRSQLLRDLSLLGHQVVLDDLGRSLQVSYATLVRSAFGSPSDTSRIRQRLTEDGILNAVLDGRTSWAGFAATPARSDVSESVAFQPLVDIISTVFNQIPSCQVSFTVNPSPTPFSERRNTSRPDAYIVYRLPATNETRWFDIVIPFEFAKSIVAQSMTYVADASLKLCFTNPLHQNKQKMVWSLHHIMYQDPLRRSALGITIEDTGMRLWYTNRAFLAVSVPIDFTTGIDDVISLFYSIGSANKEQLGWDPTVERIYVGQEIQYKFKIGSQSFITARPLATYGADAIVARGTRVYIARDENGNRVAIKDLWRDEDRELEGAILEKIFRDKVGEKEAAESEKHFVRVRVYEDIVISGKRDKMLNPREEGDTRLEWITNNVDPILTETLHPPSTEDIPDSDHPSTELARCRARPPSIDIPRRLHTRAVFEEVGIPLMNVTFLADIFACLSGALQALYYLHKAGCVHRDFSVANVLCVKKDDQWVGKLTDFDYAKKVCSDVSHDVRTGIMHFVACEVEYQDYLFPPSCRSPFVQTLIPEPPFRMNFLHDPESLWWTTIWVLLHHTDANSPTEDPYAQLRCFNKAFPRASGQASRLYFFTLSIKPHEAYHTLSTTYRHKCTAIIKLGFDLRGYYLKAEKSLPILLLDDDLLEDVHKCVSHAYSVTVEQLKESNIHLRPLRELTST